MKTSVGVSASIKVRDPSVVLDWLVAMDQYFELEEIKDPERVRLTTTKLKKTKRQAYGGHMYDRRESRRRSATKNKKFVSLRIHFYQVMSKLTY